VCLGGVFRLFVGAAAAGLLSCGGGSSSPGADFCNSWASAFCQKLYACTPADQRGADFLGGSSEAQCTQGWAATCTNPQQNGQTFDVNCSGGVHVNTAAKSACLNELSTITCDEFNSPNYSSVCTQVCVSGGNTGTGGSGGTTGTGGMGGHGTGGAGTGGAGTGGSGGSASGCGTVEPCGGDLVGTWTLTAECVDAGELMLGAQQAYYCPQAVVAASGVTLSGTATFTSSLSYTFVQNIVYTSTVDLPISCTQGLSCAQYGAYLASLRSTGTSLSCTGTSTCVCQETITENDSDSGTYVLSGSNATITSNSTGTPSTNGYCVQGSTIHLITVDPTMSTGPNHQATIVSDVVGHKQ
jgi:hypothetical protein